MLPAGAVILCAVVMDLRAELLHATVGDSLLIPCKLPAPLSLQWFYWQEDGTEDILIHCEQFCDTASENYRNRVKAFESEFSPGNISIRLHSVTAADDRRSFWAMAGYKDGANTQKTCEHCCSSTLQVSAPYRDLNLTIDTGNAATCTARGGYPESSVSWCGRHKADGECVDLDGAKTTHEENPKDGTLTVTSSIGVKELVSVTCRVVNLDSNKSINKSTEIDRGTGGNLSLLALLIPLLIIGGIVWLIYKKCFNSGNEANGKLNGGSGIDAGQGNELHVSAPREGRNEENEHQENGNQDNEEQRFLRGAASENQEHRPAGGAQPERSSISIPRRRGSPRTGEAAVTD